jgi:hypothetical protein
MSKSHDYVPHGDAEFNNWLENLSGYVSKKCSGPKPEWTHIPKSALDELIKAKDDWQAAYARFLKPHSDGVTTAKNTAKKKTVKIVRSFVQRYLRFDPVTEEDCVEMKIPMPVKKTRSILSEPPYAPALKVRPKAERQRWVDFWEEGSASRARPYGYNGAVIYYVILDSPPESMEDVAKTVLATRTPYTLEFSEADRGKRVYIAVRWQNNKGQLGPLSGIQMGFVP